MQSTSDPPASPTNATPHTPAPNPGATRVDLTLLITMALAIPVTALIHAICASRLWQWFLTPIHADLGIGPWFGAILIVQHFSSTRKAKPTPPTLPSHGEIISGVFVKIFDAAFLLVIAFAVGTLFHWIPAAP